MNDKDLKKLEKAITNSIKFERLSKQRGGLNASVYNNALTKCMDIVREQFELSKEDILQ